MNSMYRFLKGKFSVDYWNHNKEILKHPLIEKPRLFPILGVGGCIFRGNNINVIGIEPHILGQCMRVSFTWSTNKGSINLEGVEMANKIAEWAKS